MNEEDQSMLETMRGNGKAVRKFFKRLEKQKPKVLDQDFHLAHEREFETMDCLTCANCCKTTSPIFRDIDIDRLAKHLKIKSSELIALYLHMDNDGDYVLNQSPCVFLEEDHTCRVYEFRPQACRQYPHTDRKNMHQILSLTKRNTLVCPAVARIVDKMMNKVRN